MATIAPSRGGGGSTAAGTTANRLKELSATLRAHREKYGLSLSEVAEETGVSTATLSRIENAKFYPKLETLSVLCNWMQVPLSQFAPSTTEVDERETLEKVEAHFRADAKLSQEAAEEIVRVMRGLYRLHAKEQ